MISFDPFQNMKMDIIATEGGGSGMSARDLGVKATSNWTSQDQSINTGHNYEAKYDGSYDTGFAEAIDAHNKKLQDEYRAKQKAEFKKAKAEREEKRRIAAEEEAKKQAELNRLEKIRLEKEAKKKEDLRKLKEEEEERKRKIQAEVDQAMAELEVQMKSKPHFIKPKFSKQEEFKFENLERRDIVKLTYLKGRESYDKKRRIPEDAVEFWQFLFQNSYFMLFQNRDSYGVIVKTDFKYQSETEFYPYHSRYQDKKVGHGNCELTFAKPREIKPTWLKEQLKKGGGVFDQLRRHPNWKN